MTWTARILVAGLLLATRRQAREPVAGSERPAA